jgi:hypothetical protein
MRRLFLAAVVAFAMTGTVAAPALADNFHTLTGATSGQPDPMHNGIACGGTVTLADGTVVTLASTPGGGNSGTASKGTPFNPNNTKVYAGNPGNPTTDPNSPAFNPKPVSQYDVACFQATMHGH